jgi:3-oxoacyl-[acyl-carrier protein] reductase
MKILIIGGLGSIGNYIYNKLFIENNEVIISTSNINKVKENIIYLSNDNMEQIKELDELDSIIWAHGANINDNIYNTTYCSEIIDTNVIFIINTLQTLLKYNKIKNNSNLIIISSIWENITRDNKLSYTVSKSALSGLVKSLSYDLSFKNILINNICPGPIDNEMTNKTLKKENLDYIKNYLGFNRLVSLQDVWNLVYFLVYLNTGITGQSINVDLGFSNIKKYE